MSLVFELQKEVTELGFAGKFETILDYFQWLRKANLILSPEKLKEDADHKGFTGKTDTFSDVTHAFTASFGTIRLAYLENSKHNGYVFLKTSKNFQKSLLLEGLLQSAAHVALKLHGFPHGTPRVLKIAQFPDSGIGLVLEKIPNSKPFAEYLKNNFRWNQPCAENDSIVLQIITQVATSIAILEQELGMNHRDLKGSNVLMVAPVEPYTKTIHISGVHCWKFKSNLQVSIIDFGFTCIGNAGKYIVSAGDFLPEMDFCPKQGRDLFLFFASLWAIPAFRQSISEPLVQLFEHWLLDAENKSWADWLALDQKDNLLSIYLLCNKSSFLAPPCSPIRVLQDIQKVAPEIVQYALLRRPGTPVPEF